MVVVGPLTLNVVMFLLVLIRWGCQQIFGSLPSFTSKFIMAQGVWTVLNPLAVFAVDAILGVSHLKITWALVHFKWEFTLSWQSDFRLQKKKKEKNVCGGVRVREKNVQS